MPFNRSRRLSQGVFISGASGSGKSRMTERLAQPWRRVIYVDPMRSFQTATVTTWVDAATSLATFWRATGPINFGVTFYRDDDYRRFFGALAELARASHEAHTPFPRFLLVVDEVDLWSGPKFLDTNLSHLFRYGRHYGCSWIANCRADVHTNRDVRMNAAEIILFRQGMLSPELSKMVAAASSQRGDVVQDFPEVWQLRDHGADEPNEAVEGVHFLAVPDPFTEWLKRWKALATDA